MSGLIPAENAEHVVCTGRTHAQDLTAAPADASASVVEDLAAWKAGGLPLYPAADGALPPGVKRAADQG
jgi:hypothetical protein